MKKRKGEGAEILKPIKAYTLSRTAQLLGYHPVTIQYWLKKGIIKANRTSDKGTFRVPHDEVVRLQQVLQGKNESQAQAIERLQALLRGDEAQAEAIKKIEEALRVLKVSHRRDYD